MPIADDPSRAPGRPVAPTGSGGEPAPGDVLNGRYEIQSELGRGGMATVFRGRDLRLHRKVAVKVFRGAFGDPVDPRRTTQEMRLLARVDHPSVVSVLDASTGDGSVGAFLVMELVEGDDLGALLHRARGPLSADFARRIVGDVASALQALHDQGVVHRDVKPANILVPAAATHSQAVVSAKLTDFGIAQIVDGARITGPESILGTAAYLSPEQVRGGAPQPASDVYALGLVLLEALTGKRAFPGPSAEAAMARLTRPPALPSAASPDLADLLSRMTAMDPVHRPAAGEVAAVLRGQLRGRVTAPDAAITAPTPVSGLLELVPPPVSAPVDVDATRAHDAVWTLSRGMPIVTGPQPVTSPTTPGKRHRRAPAVLGAVASVLAAGIAVAAISAASSTSSPTVAKHAAPTISAPPRTSAAPDPVAVPAEGRSSAPQPTTTRRSSSAAAPSSSAPTPSVSATSPVPSASAAPSGTASAPPASGAPSSAPPSSQPPVQDPPTSEPPAPSDPPTSTDPDPDPSSAVPQAQAADA